MPVIDTEYLYSPGDLADLLNVVPSAITNWAKRYPTTFPKPLVLVARGKTPLYDGREVARWYRDHKDEQLPPRRERHDWRDLAGGSSEDSAEATR